MAYAFQKQTQAQVQAFLQQDRELGIKQLTIGEQTEEMFRSVQSIVKHDMHPSQVRKEKELLR